MISIHPHAVGLRFPLYSSIVAAAFCWAVPAFAQQPVGLPQTTPAEEPAEETESARPTEDVIRAVIDALAPQITSAEEAATAETVQRLGVSLEALSGRVDRLRALNGVLQLQIGALQRLNELQTSREDVEQQQAAFEERGPEEAPPYNLSYSDRIMDEFLAEERNADGLTSALESATVELESAREQLAVAQRGVRTAREAAEAGTDGADSPRLTWEANRARLEERYHEENVIARELRLEVARADSDIAQLRLGLAREKFDAVLAQTVFSREEFDARLSEVAARRDAAERALPKLRDTYQANEARRAEARDAVQMATGDDAITAATAALAARTAHVETASRTVELTERKVVLADQEKVLWERRFAVWRDADDALLGEWQADTGRFLNEIERDRQVQEARLIDLRASILDADKQATELPQGTGRRTVETRLGALRDRETALNDYLSTLLPAERLATRLRDEIERERNLVTWRERWSRITAIVGKVWNYEVFVFEDDSITVRKIVTALVVLVLGFAFAGRLTRTMRNRLLDRTPLNENAAAAIEKLTFYAFLILILLYTLNLVNIPLTLFAFFGGAIAIAVGFGAQHIINNFISGFILMLERPIRIGDLVQVDGIYGHIRHIGARSTRLHTAENIDLLIPNSKLLENTVTNWTLSDERLRTFVSVGVVYGSPTDVVTDLLARATADCKKVQESPKPVILFTDFGDNALGFEVHFWVKMRRIMDKRQAESEVRYNIDKLFREHNIVIAFPQRDLHLDTVKPLEIRMVAKDASRGTTEDRPSE